MFRTKPTLRSIAVLVALLAACLLGAAVLRANLSRPLILGGKMPTAQLTWSIPAAGVENVGFSRSGDYLCTVSKDGEVSCYDASGRRCFTVTVPDATDVAIAPDGSFTLVYATRDKHNSRLVFVDSEGKLDWQMNVAGAIWSADANCTDDGACFAIGTESKYVYVVSLSRRSKRYRRWRAPGVVTSVALDQECEHVLSGTWQDSTIRSSSLTGREELRIDADPADMQFVQAMADSNRLFVRSRADGENANGEAVLLENNGYELSRYPLDASQAARAIPSPDGLFVCIGSLNAIQHSGKSVHERHAALYDFAGRRLWDKGSMLLQINPILVAQNGFVLVGDGKQGLYMITPVGEIKQVCKLPATMLDWVVPSSGSCALIRCADDKYHRIDLTR